MLFGAVVAARQRKDQRVAALEFAKRLDGTGVVGQRVVREHAARLDVGTHGATSSHLVSTAQSARCSQFVLLFGCDQRFWSRSPARSAGFRDQLRELHPERPKGRRKSFVAAARFSTSSSAKSSAIWASISRSSPSSPTSESSMASTVLSASLVRISASMTRMIPPSTNLRSSAAISPVKLLA